MSRIGKKPIEIPVDVNVQINGRLVVVKGPRGELFREFRPEVLIEQKDNVLMVTLQIHSKLGRSLWGLTRTLVYNMIYGVTQGYEKRLEIEGVGYRAAVEGDSLALNLGFSHPIIMKTPEHMTVAVEKNTIIVTGIDKEQIGQFAAKVRKLRPPEPYKGKGIRYQDEIVRRKLGKKAVSSSGT